ncbi:CoA transferase [Cupriavidus basilensis]
MKETGFGQFVDVAMTDAVLALVRAHRLPEPQYTGVVPGPEGNRAIRCCVTFGLFRARDGYVSIACAADTLSGEARRTTIGRPDVWQRPGVRHQRRARRQRPAGHRPARSLHVRAHQGEIDHTTGRQGAVRAGLARRPRSLPIRTMRCETCWWTSKQPGSAQRVKIAGVPIKLSDACPVPIRRRQLQSLGEHTDEILLATGYSREDIDRLREEGAVR